MKVVHVNEHLARKGGVETYLLSLLPMLDDHGVASTVVYGAGSPEEYEPSVCVPGIGEAGFRSQKAVRKEMYAVLEREQPNVIHLHNFKNIGAIQACLDYGPTVMTTHDYRSICPASTFFYKRTQEVCTRQQGVGCFTTTLAKHCLTPRPNYAAYYYFRAKWMTEQAGALAHVIAPSAGARERLVQAGIDEKQITVLPYYCPLEPASTPRPVPSRPTITYIGRISPGKGHEYFVQALGLLSESVQGIMVGNLNEASEQGLRHLAREHGCEDRLVLRAWASRAEVVEILDQTTVFIFPSLWPETLGIVGLEALARGVPVVASDIGGVREWLRDGENGFLVEPKAPEQIRDAVLKITADERTLMAFGSCGIDTINERFLPSQHTETLVHLYEHVASRKSLVASQ